MSIIFVLSSHAPKQMVSLADRDGNVLAQVHLLSRAVINFKESGRRFQ